MPFPVHQDAFGVDGYFDAHGVWKSLGNDASGFDVDGYWRSDGEHHEPMVLEETTDSDSKDKFFIMDHDGDYQGFASIEALAMFLMWNSGPNTGGVVSEDEEIGWVNRVSDLGSVEVDDNGGSDLISWVRNSDLLDEYAAKIDGMVGLDFITDGIDALDKVYA